MRPNQAMQLTASKPDVCDLCGRLRSPRWMSKLTPEPASVGTIRLGAVVCLLMGLFCVIVAIIGE